MITEHIEINGCKHYFVNSERKPILFFIHNWQFVTIDYDTEHPLGDVYRTKNCLDSQLRFVKQQDNSVLVFNVNEWKKPTNIYLKKSVNIFKELFLSLTL